MATILEKEIERAVERRLTPVPAHRAPAPPASPASPARRPRAPVVHFSPLIAEPVAARRRRRTLVWVSIATHIVVVAVVTLMPERAQTVVEPSLPVTIVFSAPIPSPPEIAPPPPIPKPPPKSVVKPVEKPIVEAPKPAPKPVVPEPAPAPVAKVEPPRPRPAVRTGLLEEVAGGPAIMASKSSRSPIVASGFDTAASATSSTSTSRPGRVVESAFGTETATPQRSRAGNAVVQESGFGVEAAAPAKPKGESARPASALDTEVEILSKPKPVYTEEARGLRIEGDVVLEVTFVAGGIVRVLGVVSGLGHGLDEAAVDAAEKIRFNPARRDGAPVDHTARLRVVFRLA